MLQKLFGFDPAQNKLKTEVAAGITTFLTMAYILAVNPNIFSHLAAQGMYNPQNEMFVIRKTKRYIFKTKRIFFVSPSITQIM